MSWTPNAAARRFYKTATIHAEAQGWRVLLDERPLLTPLKSAFLAPRAVAEAAAAEWEAQTDLIDPLSMPVTRAVNAAIERVAPHREAVIDDIAGYGGSDLLCYRAGHPAALAVRQDAAWTPLLDWSASDLGAPLSTTVGVTPIDQPPGSIAKLRAAVAESSDIGLAALSELTALSGSLVLALAVARERLDAEAAWSASRIDEAWQIEHWGEDEEAEKAAARRRADFMAAARLAALLREPDTPEKEDPEERNET